ADGSDPAIVSDTRDADGAGGAAAGFDSGGGDVQRERVVEFAGGFECAGPGGAARCFHGSWEFSEACAEDDAGVGRGVDRPWAGEMGTCAGGRVDGRFAAVWKFAGAVFAGDVRYACEFERLAGRDVCRFGDSAACVSVHEDCVHLVRADWVVRDVRRWGSGEPDDFGATSGWVSKNKAPASLLRRAGRKRPLQRQTQEHGQE